MDVQCERCKTEYEFDDALVSGRGTTVKCTNCGLQFKVRPPPDAVDAERWVVHTARGQELLFTSLRELQRAITSHEVGRGDTLRRGNAPPRTLGTIAELEPFFLARPSRLSERPPGMEGGKSRMPTLRPPSSMAVPPSTPPARLAPVSGGVDRTAAAYSEAGTLVAPALQHASVPSVVSHQPTHREAPPPRNETVRLPAPPPAPRFDPLPPIIRRAPTTSGEYEDRLDPRDSLADGDVQYAQVPPRRRMGGWIVAGVLLACVGVVGYKVAEPYLLAATKPATHKPLDARAEQFLTEGESAFREGNLELAKEKFDKASALAEGDPRVLLDVARLAAARADVPWLLTRLLPESSADELTMAKQQLADLAAKAKQTADAAAAASPDDLATIRAHVDGLRIAGERDAARGYVTKISGTVSQSETAYVLAALDLSEIDPSWPTVIDRLRVAAAGEGNAGRARAALIYALARSGDTTAAKAELDRLKALPAAHPLTAALSAYVARGPNAKTAASAAPSASVAVRPPVVDVSSLPRSDTEEPSGGAGDPRTLLRQASAAENKGQFARATKLYEDVMHAEPANSEALAGLGSVALKTGDFASARSYFGHALSINPNFVPALVGQADAMWDEGDRKGATARYKEIVDRFPESSGYPSYVKTRAEGSSSGAAPPSPTAADLAPAAPTPAPKPSATGGAIVLPANVPSDLPGTPP